MTQGTLSASDFKPFVVRTDNIAKELVTRGLTQKDVAEKLGVTQAAVSQYIGQKRGSKNKSVESIREEISALADKILDPEVGGDVISQNVCQICMKSKSSGLLCELHREVAEVDDDCNVCVKIGKTYCQLRN